MVIKHVSEYAFALDLAQGQLDVGIGPLPAQLC